MEHIDELVRLAQGGAATRAEFAARTETLSPHDRDALLRALDEYLEDANLWVDLYAAEVQAAKAALAQAEEEFWRARYLSPDS